MSVVGFSVLSDKLRPSEAIHIAAVVLKALRSGFSGREDPIDQLSVIIWTGYAGAFKDNVNFHPLGPFWKQNCNHNGKHKIL